MARYKDYNYDQTKMLPISFDRQILPGSFEYSLSYLIDTELDLSAFEQHYNNDENGRPAYDPRLLLKIVILAYSKGITSSRQIERLCRDNIIFMALSADTQPHFTTLSDFISRSPEAIADLFGQIVLMCDELGLIGKEMFAIDGCKLPSNSPKEWSGIRSPHRGDRDQAIQSPGPKEGGWAMEVDDDATQHPEDSQIWMGMGIAPRTRDAFSRYRGQSS